MLPNSFQEYIGVDVGRVRVGIARGSSAARLAQPLKTVPTTKALEYIKSLILESSPAAIVVGLPRNLEGNDTPQTDYVRDWVEQARKALKIPFYWQDEALTSKAAEKIKRQPGPADAEAAAFILQDFLDTPKEERVRC